MVKVGSSNVFVVLGVHARVFTPNNGCHSTIIVCVCHNLLSRLSLHTKKDSTILDVFLCRKD